jgi:hypothetical protein
MKCKVSLSRPITRDTLNIFPDFVTVEGKLVDYTLGINCGVFCGCGTLKIKLVKQSIKYHEEFIFVAVPCLSLLPFNLNSKRYWSLNKLAISDNSCCWVEVPSNKFDTKGIPFYTLLNYNIR